MGPVIMQRRGIFVSGVDTYEIITCNINAKEGAADRQGRNRGRTRPCGLLVKQYIEKQLIHGEFGSVCLACDRLFYARRVCDFRGPQAYDEWSPLRWKWVKMFSLVKVLRSVYSCLYKHFSYSEMLESATIMIGCRLFRSCFQALGYKKRIHEKYSNVSIDLKLSERIVDKLVNQDGR